MDKVASLGIKTDRTGWTVEVIRIDDVFYLRYSSVMSPLAGADVINYMDARARLLGFGISPDEVLRLTTTPKEADALDELDRLKAAYGLVEPSPAAACDLRMNDERQK